MWLTTSIIKRWSENKPIGITCIARKQEDDFIANITTILHLF
jgi:hypothetical protein